MSFFKLTKRKIIFAILVAAIWTGILNLQPFFGLTITSLESPCTGGIGGLEPIPTAAPLTAQDVVENLNEIIQTNNYVATAACAGPSYDTAENIYQGSELVLRFIISYLFVCIIAFFITRMKQQKRLPVVNSKK